MFFSLFFDHDMENLSSDEFLAELKKRSGKDVVLIGRDGFGRGDKEVIQSPYRENECPENGIAIYCGFDTFEKLYYAYYDYFVISFFENGREQPLYIYFTKHVINVFPNSYFKQEPIADDWGKFLKMNYCDGETELIRMQMDRIKEIVVPIFHSTQFLLCNDEDNINFHTNSLWFNRKIEEVISIGMSKHLNDERYPLISNVVSLSDKYNPYISNSNAINEKVAIYEKWGEASYKVLTVAENIEWIKQNGNVENFSPNHVIVFYFDKILDGYAYDLNGCFYGDQKYHIDRLMPHESLDNHYPVNLCKDEDDPKHKTIVVDGLHKFIDGFHCETRQEIKEAIRYAQTLRNRLDDNWDIWCDSSFDLEHENPAEKRPFRLTYQAVEIFETDCIQEYDRIFFPAKILDESKKLCEKGNLVGYKDFVLSMDVENMEDFLAPFLGPNFDKEMHENALREKCTWNQFSWWREYFFSFAQIRKINSEMHEIARLLREDFSNPALDDYKVRFKGILRFTPVFHEEYKMSEKQIDKAVEKHKDLLIDFLERFVGHMEKFMSESEKEGFNQIVFLDREFLY